jgi:hypothetical protein
VGLLYPEPKNGIGRRTAMDHTVLGSFFHVFFILNQRMETDAELQWITLFWVFSFMFLYPEPIKGNGCRAAMDHTVLGSVYHVFFGSFD